MSILDHAPCFTPDLALQITQSLFNVVISGTALLGGSACSLVLIQVQYKWSNPFGLFLTLQ